MKSKNDLDISNLHDLQISYDESFIRQYADEISEDVIKNAEFLYDDDSYYEVIEETVYLDETEHLDTSINPTMERSIIQSDNVVGQNEIVALIEPATAESINSNKKRKRLTQTDRFKRKRAKIEKFILKHAVRQGCKESCIRKCTDIFPENHRKLLNHMYWNMTNNERREFVYYNVLPEDPKRKVPGKLVKLKNRCRTLRYYLRSEMNIPSQVCKTFFLTTLGYSKKK